MVAEHLRNEIDKYTAEGQNTPLTWAVRNGDIKSVRRLLAQGADPNAENYQKDSPVEIAASEGYVDILTLLISSGAWLDYDHRGRFALYSAAGSYRVEVVEALLNSGVDVNTGKKNGETALMKAAGLYNPLKDMDQQLRTVQLLIDRGADMSIRGPGGISALVIAAHDKNTAVVNLLKSAGAPVTFHEYLALEDYASARAAYTPETNLEELFEEGVSLLSTYAADGNIEVVTLLLELGANPNGRIWYSTTVHYAANADVLRILLNFGADPMIRDESKDTPLHWFAAAGDLESVELLLAHGADINAIGSFGHTPLASAVHHGERGVADHLLSHGADVNARKPDTGHTPLYVAAREGNTDMVRYLLEMGADPNLKSADYHGTLRTPIAMAKHQGKFDVVRMLEPVTKRSWFGR